MPPPRTHDCELFKCRERHAFHPRQNQDVAGDAFGTDRAIIDEIEVIAGIQNSGISVGPSIPAIRRSTESRPAVNFAQASSVGK